MSDLSEILGSLMISLVHARRMADEETAAVAEYYKDHPLLEGLSLPRVRVPELTIDMPITINNHKSEKSAELESPTQIHKAVLSQVRETLGNEELLTRGQSFQNVFDQEASRALKELAEKNSSSGVKATREAVVRAVDDALTASIKKTDFGHEITQEQKNALQSQVRHRVTAVSLKSPSIPTAISTSAITSEVKENANPLSSARLKITLREEGLEWATGTGTNGNTKSQLQPE